VLLGDIVVAQQSKPMKTGEAFFISGNRDGGWHCSPRRQFLIFLEGEMEMGVGDGAKRKFFPGDVLLVEDTIGHGHNSRTKGWLALVVPWDNQKP
jgi:quercetin dioxygenase-like cupin family protein